MTRQTDFFSSNYTLEVIIVTYNCEAYIAPCLDSVFSQTGIASFLVTIVDNCSQDNTTSLLSRQYPQVRLIRSSDNVGFAKANNLALRDCQAPYVLLLNPDTLLADKYFFARMLAAMDANEADICGPMLLNADDTLQRWGGGSFPSPLTAFKHYFFIANLLPVKGMYLSKFTNRSGKIDWICGACMMIRKRVVDSIGLLSPDFFMYAEDMEFCFRAKRAGFKVYYEPSISLYHYYGKCKSDTISSVDFDSLNNVSVFVKKNFGRQQGLLFDVITLLGFGLRLLIYSIANYGSRARRYNSRIKNVYKFSRIAWKILKR